MCVLVCELLSEHACVLMRVGAAVCSVCVKWVRRADQKGGEGGSQSHGLGSGECLSWYVCMSVSVPECVTSSLSVRMAGHPKSAAVTSGAEKCLCEGGSGGQRSP